MINNTPSDIFTGLNPNNAVEASRSRNVSDMGSDDFLALMIAQMKNQDPTKTHGSNGLHEPARPVWNIVRRTRAQWILR